MVPEHRALQEVRQVMRRRGVALSRHHLWSDQKEGTRRVLIALGERHNPLPSPAWMKKQIDAGNAEDGSLEGARYWLILKLWHHVGGTHDVQANLVELETGVVRRSAYESGGEGRGGLREAVEEAVDELGVRFSPATDGRVDRDTRASVRRVEEGDSLWSIAEEEYGDGSRWRRIYRANEGLVGPDPDRLEAGQVLTIP